MLPLLLHKSRRRLKPPRKKFQLKRLKALKRKKNQRKRKKSAPIKLKKEKSASPPKKTKLTES